MDRQTDSDKGMDRIRRYQDRVNRHSGTEKEYKACKAMAEVIKWAGTFLDTQIGRGGGAGRAKGSVGVGKAMDWISNAACEMDREMDNRYAKQLAVVRRVGDINGNTRNAARNRTLQQELLALADCVVRFGGAQKNVFVQRYLHDRRGRWYPFAWVQLPDRRPALGF
jgi:hypothetical protein